MMALPVWKLSVDVHQPELAPCTRSQSPWVLSRVGLIAVWLSEGPAHAVQNESVARALMLLAGQDECT